MEFFSSVGAGAPTYCTGGRTRPSRLVIGQPLRWLRTAQQMQALLKARIREMSQMEYVHAKKLIRSLSYEAEFSPTEALLAAY